MNTAATPTVNTGPSHPATPEHHRHTLHPEQAQQTAHWVIKTEMDAIAGAHDSIDTNFLDICHFFLSCTGKLVLTGVGKSGYIARKLAATLSSTGTPAFFLHPAEAGHGDMGMLSPGDVLWALSYSGESDEIRCLLPALQPLRIPLVSFTANADSTLARHSLFHLCIRLRQEACPLGLAPTASTTAMLVLGDAIAMVLSQAKKITPQDFAKYHPSGTLGRKLLLRVADVMRQGEEIPLVQLDTTLRDALFVITEKKMGMTAVTDSHNNVMGIFTDGDLRRSFAAGYGLDTAIAQVMTPHCKTCTPDLLAAEALQLMNNAGISSLLVTDAKKEGNEGLGLSQLRGAISMHDLIRAHVA